MSQGKPRLIPDLTNKQLRNFWSKIDKRGPDDCWPWLAGKSQQGYGRLHLHPVGKFNVTRIMYYLATGKQPGPLCVCHKCDNPTCCNPAHFFLGTRADNVADMIAKGRDNKSKGVGNGKAKLTNAQVLEIRASRETCRAIAVKYDINHGTVSRIRTRKCWKHI